MARRKTLPESLRAKIDLSERLAALRTELFGERGGPEMARRLGIPVRTWYNYEGGVTVPAEVVLRVIELTGADPSWLLHGRGPKFRPNVPLDHEEEPARPSHMVGALLRTALQFLEGTASPELGVAATRLVESERSLEGVDDANGRSDRARPAASRLEHDMLRADGGRGRREWLEARRDGRCLAAPDDAMAPLLPRGALFAFASEVETPASLDGRMVVARVGGSALVRWLENRGDHLLLRAEDPAEGTTRLEPGGDDAATIRRVLWIEATR